MRKNMKRAGVEFGDITSPSTVNSLAEKINAPSETNTRVRFNITGAGTEQPLKES